MRQQCLDANSAKDTGLPTSIVERRKRFAETFCTQQYFEFICFVESVFIPKLNLKMMMVHADVDLVHEIKTQMLTSHLTITEFNGLWNKDEKLSGEETKQVISGEVYEHARNKFCEFFEGNREWKC